jgi:Avidin family
MYRLIFAFALFAFTSSANAQSLAPSQWVNQRTSVMQLNYWDPFSKVLNGTYVNNAPGFPHCAHAPYHLWGTSDGDSITFTVHWAGPSLEDCHTTTVWSGHIHGRYIDALWILTSDSGQVVATGIDYFTRH